MAVFYVPFLMRSLERHRLQRLWPDDTCYGYLIDTLDLAKKIFQNADQKPMNTKLGTLFQFETGQVMENSHRALGDVRALYSVFVHDLVGNYWIPLLRNSGSVTNWGSTRNQGYFTLRLSEQPGVPDILQRWLRK